MSVSNSFLCQVVVEARLVNRTVFAFVVIRTDLAVKQLPVGVITKHNPGSFRFMGCTRACEPAVLTGD